MARLHDCLADIDTWMTLNRLKLNKEKTELLVLHSRHRPPPAFASLKIGSEVIIPSDSSNQRFVTHFKFNFVLCIIHTFSKLYKLIKFISRRDFNREKLL